MRGENKGPTASTIATDFATGLESDSPGAGWRDIESLIRKSVPSFTPQKVAQARKLLQAAPFELDFLSQSATKNEVFKHHKAGVIALILVASLDEVEAAAPYLQKLYDVLHALDPDEQELLLGLVLYGRGFKAIFSNLTEFSSQELMQHPGVFFSLVRSRDPQTARMLYDYYASGQVQNLLQTYSSKYHFSFNYLFSDKAFKDHLRDFPQGTSADADKLRLQLLWYCLKFGMLQWLLLVLRHEPIPSSQEAEAWIQFVRSRDSNIPRNKERFDIFLAEIRRQPGLVDKLLSHSSESLKYDPELMQLLLRCLYTQSDQAFFERSKKYLNHPVVLALKPKERLPAVTSFLSEGEPAFMKLDASGQDGVLKTIKAYPRLTEQLLRGADPIMVVDNAEELSKVHRVAITFGGAGDGDWANSACSNLDGVLSSHGLRYAHGDDLSQVVSDLADYVVAKDLNAEHLLSLMVTGHSWGSSNAFKTSREKYLQELLKKELQKRGRAAPKLEVDMLFTIDPVRKLLAAPNAMGIEVPWVNTYISGRRPALNWDDFKQGKAYDHQFLSEYLGDLPIPLVRNILGGIVGWSRYGLSELGLLENGSFPDAVAATGTRYGKQPLAQINLNPRADWADVEGEKVPQQARPLVDHISDTAMAKMGWEALEHAFANGRGTFDDFKVRWLLTK